MNVNEFNSVAAELREIEHEFTSGHMNAFGTAATKENFIRELRKIADIETQVFYRACTLLSASTAEDHVMRSVLFASAEQSGAKSNTGSATDMDGSASAPTNRPSPSRRDGGKASATEMTSFASSFATERRSSHGDGRDTAGTGQTPWNNDAGFSDRPFQDVSRHFKMLEGEFTALGEHLRQISTHVMQLNDMAERTRSTSEGGYEP